MPDLSEAKGITAAELPKAALDSIANSGLDLTFRLPTGAVTLDEKTAASVVSQAGGEKLSAALAPVWYLNGAAELEKLACTYENGVVTVALGHLSLYVVGRDTNPFAGVGEDAWFADSVKCVYEKGLMNGTGATAFSPYGTTTRGILVAILRRLEGAPEAGGVSFSDVAAGKYYAKAIAWAAGNQIVSGYADGTFRPDAAVTRQQMAEILLNYAGLKGYDVSERAELSGFADAAAVAGYAGEAVAWANAEGLIQGGSPALNSAGKATRAQAAAILQRFMEKAGK